MAIAANAFSVVLGLAVILGRKPFARYTIAEQNRHVGFHFGEREVRMAEFVNLVVGAFALVMGLWGLASAF